VELPRLMEATETEVLAHGMYVFTGSHQGAAVDSSISRPRTVGHVTRTPRWMVL
jgi:hypothetical protein